jgi:hypothetical protein
VFAPISAIFSLLLFASTLPNGIRVAELPSEGDHIEIVAGYTASGLTGFFSTTAARRFLAEAYAIGADVEFITDQDRTAFRFTAPKWASPMLMEGLPNLFKEVGAAPTSPTANDFRAKVEEEIRNALLGPDPPQSNYTTGDAFILISESPTAALREALGSIPSRGSSTKLSDGFNRLVAERTLRFKSDQAEGAVIFASPVPGAYYKQWYLVLVLDRLIHRIVPLRVATSFPLTVRPYYYRIELPVPSGQFPEPIEENLMQELQRLQFTPASARDLTAAREEALAYLNSKPVREWFASYDMMDRREEGIQWIQSMTADDMRVAARDLLIMNRVVATWSPRPRQTSVSSQPLNSVSSDGAGAKRQPANQIQATSENAAGEVMPFPSHTDPTTTTRPPERLPSGVSIVESTSTAVFVAGNGMTRFNREFTADDLKSFVRFRPERILVLVPNSGLVRTRQLWSTFKGAASGETGVARGKVSNGDLAALFIIKTIVDLKLIQIGLWPEVSVAIDASTGTDLQIHGPDDVRAQIRDWIKSIANAPLPDSYFSWVREVAMHHFSSAQPDLQALTWERDPQAVVPNVETVSPTQVQDVARIYF